MKLTKLFILLSFLVTTTWCFAGNWYVHKGATGLNNGTSWTNAWNEWSAINFSSVACGDTIWVAGVNGGTAFANDLSLNKVCTSSTRLLIRRVLSTDAVPVAAPGWSPTFDSQVVSNNTTIVATAGSSFITIDGRQGDARSGIPYGMQFNITSDNDSFGIDRTGATTFNGLTYTYLEFHGPSCVTGSGLGSGTCVNNSWGYHSNGTVANNTLLDHNWWHRFSEIIRPFEDKGMTVQYSYIGEANDTKADHGDMIYGDPSTSNFTWKFNVVYTNHNQGFWFDNGGDSGYANMIIANNIVIGNATWVIGFPRCVSSPACGPIYVYNNAIITDTAFGPDNWIGGNTGQAVLGSGDWANNIFLNVQTQVNINIPTTAQMRFDAFDNGHSISCSNCFSYTKPNPLCTATFWVNMCPNSDAIATLYQADLHLTSAGKTAFQAKGVNLTTTACATLDADICKDMDGNTRPTSGGWTLGPFEANSTAFNPSAPSGITVVVN